MSAIDGGFNQTGEERDRNPVGDVSSSDTFSPLRRLLSSRIVDGRELLLECAERTKSDLTTLDKKMKDIAEKMAISTIEV